jgi:uncharacterized protein (DUF433 family)
MDTHHSDHGKTYAPAPNRGDPCAPIYSMGQAAQLAQLVLPTAKRWLDAKDDRHKGGLVRLSRGVGPLDRSYDSHSRLSFQEMLTLRVVKVLRRHGLSLPAIKRVAAMAAAEGGSSTPLVTPRFCRVGARLFLADDDADWSEADPEAPERDDQESLYWQDAFTDLLERGVFQQVDWEDGLAVRWWPQGRARGVVIDPCILGGMPHITTTWKRTRTIALAVRAAGRSCALVAEEQGISVRQVRDAVAFETEWFETELPDPD